MRISVITPSFNQADFIEKTLNSVLKDQNYDDIQHIVIDGLSTDGTINILRKFIELYPQKFTFVSEKDNGQSDAINKGFRMAKGEIIGWINSDDYYEPNIFTFVTEFFQFHPDVDMIYGICHLVDREGNFIMDNEKGHAFKKCRIDYLTFKYENLMDIYSGLISQPAVFFRRKVFEKVGYLDESYSFVMDYEFWLRIGRVCKIERVGKLLAHFRTHEDAKTTFRNRFGFIKESLRARRQNGGRLLTPFYLYIGLIAVKTMGRIVLTKLGIIKEKSGVLRNG